MHIVVQLRYDCGFWFISPLNMSLQHSTQVNRAALLAYCRQSYR